MAKTSNAREWAQAMKAWRKAKRGASHDDVVNHFGGQACAWAIRFTPKARKSKHLGDAAKPELLGGALGERAPGVKRSRPTKMQQKMWHSLANKTHKRGQGNYYEALRIYSKRRRSIGFIKAGFLKPAAKLDPRFRAGRGVELLPGKSASRSFGTMAKRGNMRAKSFNNAAGSGEVAFLPMERAMAEVARREHEWAIRRLQKENNKFSARRF